MFPDKNEPFLAVMLGTHHVRKSRLPLLQITQNTASALL